MIAYILAVIFVLIQLASCASKPFSPCEETTNYFKGRQLLVDGHLRYAADVLENVRACGVDSLQVSQAHIELIYVYMQDYQLEKAMSLIDSFIRFYPQHENIDYVYYLRGLHYFYANSGTSLSLFVDDTSDRSLVAAEQSYANLQNFLQKFPQSVYAFDARAKLAELKEILAKHHIHIATYYMQRGIFIAAAKRANLVLEQYADVNARKKALYIMQDAYNALHIEDLAHQVKDVITANKQ